MALLSRSIFTCVRYSNSCDIGDKKAISSNVQVTGKELSEHAQVCYRTELNGYNSDGHQSIDLLSNTK